jgi:uncharacterized protein YjeT (DUF2065 family)
MKLAQKVKDALDEVRMLVLGSQILLGFQYNAAFHEGFENLPRLSKALDLVALVFMLAVVALLMFPPAWHRIVEEGRDSDQLLRVVTRIAALALLPFAASLALDLFIVLERIVGVAAAGAAGGATILGALFFWYVLEFVRRRKLHPEKGGNATGPGRVEDPGLEQKIVEMLTEARVILPGAQALLGFALAGVLTKAFEQLPETSKLVHAGSLCALALSVILLIAPAAYHRIVYEGEPSAQFHRIGGVMILAATLPLAIALCADLYVVLQKILGSEAPAAWGAAASFAGFVGLWYVYPALARRARTGSLSLLPRPPGFAR